MRSRRRIIRLIRNSPLVAGMLSESRVRRSAGAVLTLATSLVLALLLTGGVAASGLAKPSAGQSRTGHTRRLRDRAALSAEPLAARPRNSRLNPIQRENAKPGTLAWQLPGGTRRGFAAQSHAIRGYASEISLAPGDQLRLHVNTTPAGWYRIQIFRLGWYQGLGGRLIACLPSCSGRKRGVHRGRPVPDPTTGYLDAGWPVTDRITVGRDWTSGYFVAKLIRVAGATRGQASWVPFVVRAALGVHTQILVQASVNTWQAYNAWGGKSLYPINSVGATVPASGTVAAASVSFNRPFGPDPNAGPYVWEYQLVRYVERRGFDVSYQTDVDTDRHPSTLLGHDLDVVSGHDEYWSKSMRDGYEAALARGVNLAFIGGNIGVWQIRYTKSDRALTEYRSAVLDPEPNPALKTVMFRSLVPPRPQCTLLGIGQGGLANVQSDPPRSYAVTLAATSDPWFRGTGLAAGDTIFDSVGYEWDNVKPKCTTPALRVLLHFPGVTGVKGSPASADAVSYRAPSGARVFSAGTMQLVWALDDYGHPGHADPRVQRLVANIFTDLGR